jgi:hypothetical protein
MSSPTQPTGGRFIISQPRERWEINDRPLINESPEAIVSYARSQCHDRQGHGGVLSSPNCFECFMANHDTTRTSDDCSIPTIREL